MASTVEQGQVPGDDLGQGATFCHLAGQVPVEEQVGTEEPGAALDVGHEGCDAEEHQGVDPQGTHPLVPLILPEGALPPTQESLSEEAHQAGGDQEESLHSPEDVQGPLGFVGTEPADLPMGFLDV